MNSINNKFLIGHSIELRVPSEEDIQNSNWHSWYNDMTITRHNSHGIYPVNRDQEIDIIRDTMNRDDTILCSIYDLQSEKLIGNAALQNIDLLNRHCNLAVTIGEQAPFTTAVETFGLLSNHAFMRLNMERVHDSTHEKLRKLVVMLSVLGFKEEGIMERFVFRDNCWYSRINYVVFREDFIALCSERSGNILFENINDLQSAIINSVKTSG